MVSISYDRYVLVVNMAYNEDCIHALKQVIPQAMRKWDPDLRIWYIGLPWLGVLLDVLREYFDEGEIFISDDVPNLTALKEIKGPHQSPYGDLYLLPGAPKEVAYAAYKALAKLFHPDAREGDLERMKKINLAWEKIKQQYQ